MLINHALLVSGRHLTAIGGGGNCFSFGTHFDPIATVMELPEEEFDEEAESHASDVLVRGKAERHELLAGAATEESKGGEQRERGERP